MIKKQKVLGVWQYYVMDTRRELFVVKTVKLKLIK